jgi:hypothetical protein
MRRLPGLVLALAVPAFVVLLVFVLAGKADTGKTAAEGAHAWAPMPLESATPVFSATVHVVPSTTTLRVGESLSVSVAIRVSEGCRFPIYELTLFQDEPLFAYTVPSTATVGPPVSNPFTYTLTAVAPGTTTLGARAYGERYCDDFWVWRYLHGVSVPVTVWEARHKAYLPLVARDGAGP